MNRKGDTSFEPIVILTIAIFVLVIVGLGFYTIYSGKIQFANYLPDFLRDNSTVEEKLILRYGILKDTLEYSDGSGSWRAFSEEEVEYDGKELGDVKQVFKDYWYSDREQVLSFKGYFLNIELINSIEANERNYPISSVVIDSRDLGLDNLNPPIYVISINDLIFYKENILWSDGQKTGERFVEVKSIHSSKDYSFSYANELSQLAIEWRDSVLGEPIEIADKNLCADKVMNNNEVYLVVDLSKESDGKCNYEIVVKDRFRAKWTLDSAIKELEKRSGKYSANKKFIDQLYQDRLMNEEEYEDITGLGVFNKEEDMGYVLDLLNLKKKLNTPKELPSGIFLVEKSGGEGLYELYFYNYVDGGEPTMFKDVYMTRRDNEYSLLVRELKDGEFTLLKNGLTEDKEISIFGELESWKGKISEESYNLLEQIISSKIIISKLKSTGVK